MSDLYAVDLAVDLSPAVPSAILDDLRMHLGTGSPEAGPDEGDEMVDVIPLLSARGPAARIGGVLVGELVQSADRWSLTARQEVHAEFMPDLESLAERLALHAKTEGVIGQVRFYEEDVPELLINKAGVLVKARLRWEDPAAE